MKMKMPLTREIALAAAGLFLVWLLTPTENNPGCHRGQKGTETV
ncbi:MAG: hypothetical protein KatS3mg072_1083 [Meiothermus sp.]|nr:MAG: hypothetical protein KatS3mg072_1083 [Meiothermus sp.]